MIHVAVADDHAGILADGIITAEERAHLTDTLLRLLGGTLDELAESRHVAALPIDNDAEISVREKIFSTRDFVFGPRTVCEQAIATRGGLISASVTKKLHYLVVGGLGSPEWKHGSFETKIEKAVEYRTSGAPLRIVHEDVCASSLRG